MLFSEKHIIALGITFGSLAIALFFCIFFLRNKSQKAKMMPLKVAALLLMILEFVKYAIILKGRTGIDVSSFPLHLCSMFLWTFPIAVFATGKIKNYAMSFSCMMGIIAGFSVIIGATTIPAETSIWYPLTTSSNEGVRNLIGIQSILFHLVLVFFPIYALSMRLYNPTFKGALESYVIAFSCGIVALCMNVYLGSGLYMLGNNGTNGIGFMDNLVANIGYGAYIPIFFTVLFAVNIFTWLIYAVVRQIKQVKIKKQYEIQDGLV